MPRGSSIVVQERFEASLKFQIDFAIALKRQTLKKVPSCTKHPLSLVSHKHEWQLVNDWCRWACPVHAGLCQEYNGRYGVYSG